ncbi:hypothetical protein SAMN05421747_12912 [Parapedobacter composti]|uniref:PsbP protein n=2 Tax=Parapedobacter composti TaxID=623281 RepID=A0A1I1M585_9SPHI|nr:hypothetical protein SAMN05421747_12912 [Parapedobacter composti]
MIINDRKIFIFENTVAPITMTAKILGTIFLFLAVCNGVLGQTIFENSRFKFQASIPDDWMLRQEIKADTLNYTIVGWGMPKVYTEMDKHEVENAVSITAIEHPRIKNLDDLVKAEFNRVKNAGTILNQVQIDSVEHTAYITNTLMKNVSYVSQQYFIFKNGRGYIVTFTATVGTFSINAPKFEEFYKTVVIL